MPISIALFLGIPIGAVFYFEARWLIRYVSGHYEQRERKAARIMGVFGALLVPIIYCIGTIEEAVPGSLGKTLAFGFIAVATWGTFGSMLLILSKGK
jgi:hypothetical protein